MKKILFLLLIFLLFGITQAEKREAVSTFAKTNLVGQTVVMDINNVELKLENNGNNGLDGQSYYPAGSDKVFLFAGGVCFSGYVDGDLRTAWMASASRIEELQPGKYGMDPSDPKAKFYEVTKDDLPGSQNYIDWADAVELGADFVDIDGDGVYDPYVDMPDIIGDKTIWTVYNDNTPSTYRDILLTEPMGIEIHQSVFSFASSGALGDIVFIRYRVINQTDTDIEDMIITAWVDPDLGDYMDDLIGCDTTLSIGYIYNDGDDAEYGANPPAFGIDFFQGPIVDSPGDTAYVYRGPLLGIDTVFDSKNLPMTSFMYYIQSHATLGDPDNASEARYYQEGGVDKLGEPIVPIEFGFGTGADEDTDPTYIFSGDPVTGEGWLDDPPSDKRFMVNSGPFQLAAHDTQDVVVAYIVSQGTSALNSVTKLKEEDITAQAAYDANFFIAGAPPSAEYDVRVFDNKFEFVIDMNNWIGWEEIDSIGSRQQFQGFAIYQFNSPSASDVVDGQVNAIKIAAFDLQDEYGDIYENKGEIIKVWDGQNNLNPDWFVEGYKYFTYQVTTDAFNNNQPLINGKEYYFAIVPFSIDVNTIEEYDVTRADGDWLVSSGGLKFKVYSSGFCSVIPGSSEFNPYKDLDARTDTELINHVSGNSDGYVTLHLVKHEDITGDDYRIEFFDDGNMWRLVDETTGAVCGDSITLQGYTGDETIFPLLDGMSVRVFNKEDRIDSCFVTDSSWVIGRSEFEAPDSAVFNNGINYVKYFKASFADSLRRENYFPVKVVLDTVDSYVAYRFFGPGWIPAMTPLNDIFIAAYDMSDPDNPRQLNVLFDMPSPFGAFDLPSGNKNYIIITTSDYDTTGASYTAASDITDGYIVMNLERDKVNDSTFYDLKAFKMEINIIPTYVNADNDVYTFSSAEFSQALTLPERKEILSDVKVVPNPYWAYSEYETSYDAPIIKFTHLDRVATVRIFNVAGQLVKTLKKNDDSNLLVWDLRNEAGLKIASGMYIAYVEVPDVGHKIIKFAVIQREERIDQY